MRDERTENATTGTRANAVFIDHGDRKARINRVLCHPKADNAATDNQHIIIFSFTFHELQVEQLQDKGKSMSDTIIWEDNETPVAVRFDDPYYSKKDGRAETRHVFVEGNQLPDRFAACTHFHVAELGFGTALNFLETVQTWQQHAPEGAQLIYTSFELYPLTKQDMTRAVTPWPDLLALAQPFLDLSLIHI